MPAPDQQRRRHAFVLGVLLVLGVMVSVLAAVASPPVDEGLYRWARELDVALPWNVLADVRSLPVVLVLALPVVLARRCRVALAGSAAAVAAAAVLVLLLQALAARPRPYDSALTGEDSYPSPLLLVLALVLTTYPLWLRPGVAARAWALLTAALWALVLLSGLQEAHAAQRWPLDVLGALVVGALLGTLVRVAVDSPALHGRCRQCPWQGTERPAEPAPAEPAPAERTHGGAAHPLYRTAVAWTLGLVAVFGYLFWTRGVPRIPESGVVGTGLEVPLNLGLLGLLLVGVLLAARWHVLGAVTVAFAATLLGFAASAHYYPTTALGVATVAFVPALLLWVQWHRVASLKAVTAVATTTALVLGVTVYFAATQYTYYWGPTHPTSATPALADDVVEWMWSGAVTPTSVTVKARLADPADAVRLVVGRGQALDEGALSDPVAPDGDRVVALTVDGLSPDTAYRYALEVDGDLETGRVGRFRTYPDGPASFRFVVGADARTGSNGMVFDAIRRTRPLLYLNVGDFFYGDVERNNPDLYRAHYEANLTAPAQEALYAVAPFAYTWGDHDYGGNDADGTATGKPAVMSVFRQYVPHYPLRDGPEAPIFQAFTVGDVRFVLTDNRSQRAPVTEQPRGMLGERQLQWLRAELQDAERYGLVVWANADPWVGRPDPTSDTWQGCAAERAAIADMIAELEVDNLFMVSGDAHMLAWDDGTNTDYSKAGTAAFPLLQAAALDRKPSIKGGPYSGPVIAGGGQFGLVDVQDDGETVTVTAEGLDYRGEVLFTRTFTRTR